MTAVAIDTNAYTAFRKAQPDAVEIFSMADQLVVPAIVLGELRAGFALGTRQSTNERDLTRFLASARVSVQDVDERVSVVYGSVFMQLRRAGTPVPTNDMWIAATVLVAGAALFTFDAHFAAVEAVRVVKRWSEVVQ